MHLTYLLDNYVTKHATTFSRFLGLNTMTSRLHVEYVLEDDAYHNRMCDKCHCVLCFILRFIHVLNYLCRLNLRTTWGLDMAMWKKMDDMHMLQILNVCSIFKLSLLCTKTTIEVYLLS